MTQFFHRHGAEFTGKPENIDLAKGTAVYHYKSYCGRCGGAGSSEAWRFTGYTCYECGGSGNPHWKVATVYTAERLAKLNEIAAKRLAKKKAAQDAADAKARELAAADLAAWKAVNPEIWAFLDRNAPREGDEGAAGSEFYGSLYEQLYKRGGLSEKQMDILRDRIAREKSRAEALATSAHVGDVGERRVFFLRVEKKIALHTPGEYNPYGPRYIFLCRDEAGRRIVYKGNAELMHDLPHEGGEVSAKVRAHEEYKEEKQTIIERPTAPGKKKAA